MADYVEKYADKASDELEKQIKRVYKQAAEEVQKKLDDFIRAHKARDAEMSRKVASGELSEQNYKKWMQGQVFQGKQWRQKLKDVTDVYVHADEKAREIVGKSLKNVFMESANYTAYDIEKGMRGAVAFNVYDAKTVERLLKDNPKMLPEWKIDQPKDYTWNEKRVRNAVTQGIIQGESIEKVGSRLTEELATSNAKKMDMFARTAVNGAQNAGRMDRLHEAEDMGIEVKKKWLATLDNRTRDTHQALDGQEQPVDEPFVVDGMKIDYPGDPFAPPELVYNCRCTLTYVYPKYQHLQHNHERRDQLNDKNIENMTYYEWAGLASKNKQEEEVEEEEPTVGHKVVQGKDITKTWARRSNKFKFEIDDVINAQGFDNVPIVVSEEEFKKAVEQSNFIAQRTYSAPNQETLDAYREQLYSGKWYVDCSVGTAAYGQGMYATGDFNGQITENMQKATDFYIGLNEQKGNSVAATEVFTLQADAKIANYEKLYSEFTKYGMETQEKNAEIRRTAVNDASKELADKMLKDAGFNEDYAKKFFYGNLSLADVGWEEMGKAYKQLGAEGVRKMQELQSEYYKKQTEYVDKYVKEKSIDEIKDIGSFAASLGYDAIRVENHGIYDTTEVVVLNRTKCIFLDTEKKEEPKPTEETKDKEEPKPSKETQEKETKNVSYQYHATTAKAVIGIAEKGLQPNRGHVGKGIYFADNVKDALEWVETTSTGGTTVLRVSEEYLEKDKLEKYSASETGYGLAESVYDGKVPLEHIQIKVNDNGDEYDWWSLAQYLKNYKAKYNMLDSKTKKKVDKIYSEESARRLEKLESKDEPKLSKHTITAIDDYIEGRGNKFTKTEVEEIKTNMKKTEKTLYRVEDLSWMAENLENGDKFEFDKPIKSFTHSYKSIKDVIAEGVDAGLYESDVLVIYETVDDTYQLDVSSMSRNHEEEEESFVSGKFEVVDQEDGPIINGIHTWRILIRQIRK